MCSVVDSIIRSHSDGGVHAKQQQQSLSLSDGGGRGEPPRGARAPAGHFLSSVIGGITSVAGIQELRYSTILFIIITASQSLEVRAVFLGAVETTTLQN